ncbi:MAG: transposase [Acidimicrobiales bacterium]
MGRPSKYPPELRRRAIAELVERDRKIPEVAREPGLGSPETLRNWVKQSRRDAGLEVGPTTEEIAMIRKLRKEVAEQQRTIEMATIACAFATFGLSTDDTTSQWVRGRKTTRSERRPPVRPGHLDACQAPVPG